VVQAKYTDYNLFYRPTARGLYIQFRLEAGDSGPSDGRTTYTTSNDFIFYDYPFLSGTRLPKKLITVDYATDGVTVIKRDTTKYSYDNHSHLFVTGIRTYNGKGDSLFRQISYPQDMVLAGNDPSGVYGSMSAANMINFPIKVTEFKNATQLEQSITNYQNNSGIIKPSNISLQILSNPAETRLTYNSYDNLGNLTTVSKYNGPLVSYLWAYKGAYPVIEVKNASYQDLVNVLGQPTITQLTQNTTDVLILNAAMQLRAGLPNALVTTCLYKPMIGVSSATDPKGETTYYEYDSFQRLKNIKDTNHNITKHLDYHYQGQN
jgi:YD repeat-containing protein